MPHLSSNQNSESGLFDFRGRNSRAVASGTVFRRRLVEENCLGRNDPRQFVAVSAAHVLMRAAQRELRSFFVIEERWLPFRAVVALRTAGNVPLCKLLAMDIFMAVFALCRSRFEVHIDQLRLEIRRLVTVHASCSAMCP